MILHTIMPSDLIFPQAIAQSEYTQMQWGVMETCKNEAGDVQVRRLITTDPMMYLKAEYAPGITIAQDKG